LLGTIPEAGRQTCLFAKFGLVIEDILMWGEAYGM
jgi:hypothetical protein